MAGRYWREAATLIIVGRNLQHKVKNQEKIVKPLDSVDYNVVFLKRSAKSSFMPSSYVFPGGELDKADLNPEWLSLYEKHGFSKMDLLNLLRFPNNRLEVYTNKPIEDLVPELAIRLCALRETFEETGLLLTSSENLNSSFPHSFKLESSELKKWRKRVHDDASEFIKLFKLIDKLPSILSLLEWSSWLTPTSFGGYKKRFDTSFYITFIDLEIPTLIHDSNEAEELKIASPIELLKSFRDEELILQPPQFYELLRMVNFENFDQFEQFSRQRTSEGLSRWMPIFIPTKDGKISILPGDELYPENPNFYEDVARHLDQPSEDFVESSHRLIFTKTDRMKDLFINNVTDPNGHVKPKDWVNVA